MAIKFGSILHVNNSGSEATLDANNLRGTTLQIDDFTSASLAEIGTGLSSAPGKRRLGTIVSTTGSFEYYLYSQTGSGDELLSGSEWTTLTNWKQIATTDNNNIEFTHITASGNISASGDMFTKNLTVSQSITTDALSINGIQFENVVSTEITSTTTKFSGSIIIGSGSSTDSITPIDNTHQITGSITITGSGIFPDPEGTIDLGDINRKFNNLYAVNTFFGGVHEINLETEGLDKMQEGTVLTLKNGTLHPCEKEADPLVMGIVSNEENFPIILGAEPVLVTGKIKEGDYIITSNIKGHGKGINPQYIYDQQLFGKIIAQAIEGGHGKSHIIKAMIRKM
jgi:hypothetical protein